MGKSIFHMYKVSVQTPSPEPEPAGEVFTRFEAGPRLARADQTRHFASTSPARGLRVSLLLTNSWEEVRSHNMNIATGPQPPLPSLFTLFKLSYRRLTPEWDFD